MSCAPSTRTKRPDPPRLLASKSQESAMAAEFDLVVRNGTVIDGTGREPREADLAVQDGRIAAIGRIAGAGREEIDAKGMAVTPGFVGIPTHYGGQATRGPPVPPAAG